MVITELKENKEGHQYAKRHKVQFDFKSIDEYKRYFSELEAKGVVDEGTFDSNRWVINNNKEDRRRAIFKFTFEIYPDFQMALKSYVLFMVNIKKQDVNTIGTYLNYISHIANITNMFSKDKINAIKEYFKQYKIDNDGIIKGLYQKKKPLLNFISLLNLPYGDEYINLINNEFAGYKYKNGVRDLPPFEDLIIFGVIVQDFFNKNDIEYQELREKFAIVKVWWELTTIIPMRVGEFIRLKKGALTDNHVTGKHYLEIPRIKRNMILHENEVINIEEYEIQTLEVTQEIANLINEYKNKYVRKAQNFLFTSIEKHANKVNKLNVGVTGFANIVNDFMQNVVHGIYGHDILRKVKFKNPEDQCDKMVAVQGGDTRHIAIGNMVEMGVNPYIISKMAYHNDINAQLGYAMYIIKEAEVKSKALAAQLAGHYERASKIIDSNLDIVINSEVNNDKATLALRRGQGLKVKHGVCISEHGPFNCMENICYFCKYFIPIINNKNKNEIKAIVDRFRNKIYGKLKITQESIVQLLQEISKKSIKQEDGTFTGEQKFVEELQTQYNKAVNLKNRLVVVEALSCLEKKVELGERDNNG